LLYDNDDVTFPIQVEHLLSVLDSNEVCQQLVDTNNNATWNVVGYSWGARLAMALSTVCPERIHKLHLTGVALNRSPAGHVALQAWRDVLLLRDDELSNNKLRAFAWMALQTTYSSEFLYQQRDKLESWIQFLLDNNSMSGLAALLEQTYPTDCNDPWHVESMAKRIQQQNGDKQISGCLLVGDEDVMAPVESARELAAILSWSLHTVESCGHAVPLQKPREWRQHVLEFLS
jgi:pimeloyl-ACP methyl ester carboxylesterase